MKTRLVPPIYFPIAPNEDKFFSAPVIMTPGQIRKQQTALGKLKRGPFITRPRNDPSPPQ